MEGVNTLKNWRGVEYTKNTNRINKTETAKVKFADKLAPLIHTLTSAENTNALTLLITKLLQRPNSIISLLDSKASKKYPELEAVAKNFHKYKLHKKFTDGLEQSVSMMLKNFNIYLKDKPEKRQEIVRELSLLTANLLTKYAPNKKAEEIILTEFIKEINSKVLKPTRIASLVLPLIETSAKYPEFMGNVVKGWQDLSKSFNQNIDLMVSAVGQVLRIFVGAKYLATDLLR